MYCSFILVPETISFLTNAIDLYLFNGPLDFKILFDKAIIL